MAVALPQPPKTEEWSSIEKLSREKDLVGIYLSAHPLDDFSIILNNMCNTQCVEVGDRSRQEELSQREEVTFGGIVTKVTQKFTKRGSPFGLVTLEDFSGSGEIALFGEEWGKWNGKLSMGCSVFVKAKYVKMYPTSQSYTLAIQNVEYMQTVKNERIERLTIKMPSKCIDEALVNDLMTIVCDNPGHTELYFNIVDEEKQVNVLLRSEKQQIEVGKELIQYIDQRSEMSYYIN